MQRQALALGADPRDGSTLVLALLIHPPADPTPPRLHTPTGHPKPPHAVLVAHVGDSAAVGCGTDGTATRLTADHAPDRADELERILEAGGRVTRRSAHGVARLQVEKWAPENKQ